jgi:hypothetical protein
MIRARRQLGTMRLEIGARAAIHKYDFQCLYYGWIRNWRAR